MMISNTSRLTTQASVRTQRFLSKAPKSSCDAVLALCKPRAVTGSLLDLVETEAGDIMGPSLEHDRVSISGRVYHSEEYRRPNKTDCTAMVMPTGEFVKIQHLVSLQYPEGNTKVFAISHKYAHTPAYNTTHIMKCRRLTQRCLVEMHPGAMPCVYMNINNQMYFAQITQKALCTSL